jgi:hypothetical protein
MTALDAGRTYALAEVFGGLQYPVRMDHDYFVPTPPKALELTASQLQALEVRAPFFVDHGWSFGPDRHLVPFVWDPRAGGQHRFSEAEALTDYDSGLFGLASICAPTPDGQAQLYAVLAHAILEVHRSNRDLLAEWLDAQGPSSSSAFVYFDRERRPAEEKLLAADGAIDRALWDARLDELAACLTQDAFRKHHFRWVEFLAHAVDVPQLVSLVRAAQ